MIRRNPTASRNLNPGGHKYLCRLDLPHLNLFVFPLLPHLRFRELMSPFEWDVFALSVAERLETGQTQEMPLHAGDRQFDLTITWHRRDAVNCWISER